MIEIRETSAFVRWFRGLRDREVRARVLVRIRRLSLGNPGDVAPIGEGVSEMRIHHGPGYRVYYVRRGERSVVLLGGGDKSSRQRDIGRAPELARRIR